MILSDYNYFKKYLFSKRQLKPTAIKVNANSSNDCNSQLKERKDNMSHCFIINTNKNQNHSQLDDNMVNFLKQHSELFAALLSGIIVLSAWLLQDYFSPVGWIAINSVAFMIGGYAKAKEGILATIQTKKLNVELLMIVAAIGAASIGHWTEGAILIFIFALSGALETYTMQKSEKELSALINLQPETALRVNNNQEELILVENLVIDDLIFIKPGERVPADGTVISGKSSIDESALTGEALPVTKQVEDEVYTGTMNSKGSLTVKVTKDVKDSFVQQIMKLVQSAQNEKSASQLFIERFEGTYVKAVLLLVTIMSFLPHYLFGWSWEDTLYRAIVLLVVASPCALVASIMPATLSAISTGAKNGILFKSGVHVENLSHIKVIAFDKTGTLTNGTPKVTDFLAKNEQDKTSILSTISSIEKGSSHPLAEAIVSFAVQKGITDAPPVDTMEEATGKGVTAKIGTDKWSIGNSKFLKEDHGNEIDDNWYPEEANRLAMEAKTLVYIAKNEQVVALLALKDEIRVDTVKAINDFRSRGIHTVMLTGDNETTAQAIAKETNIDHYVASCMPEDKVTKIKQLKKKYGSIMMIGDGINDAPALATADIGVAMGAGTDVALETADIVLIKNKLEKISFALSLSKRMNRIIKQNASFSITIILMLILTNFLQIINLPLGVLGHEGSTILVILNGLRLLK